MFIYDDVSADQQSVTAGPVLAAAVGCTQPRGCVPWRAGPQPANACSSEPAAAGPPARGWRRASATPRAACASMGWRGRCQQLVPFVMPRSALSIEPPPSPSRILPPCPAPTPHQVLQRAICPERGQGDSLSAIAGVTHVHVTNDLQVAGLVWCGVWDRACVSEVGAWTGSVRVSLGSVSAERATATGLQFSSSPWWRSSRGQLREALVRAESPSRSNGASGDSSRCSRSSGCGTSSRQCAALLSRPLSLSHAARPRRLSHAARPRRLRPHTTRRLPFPQPSPLTPRWSSVTCRSTVTTAAGPRPWPT
jgi:hypothetical protein